MIRRDYLERLIAQIVQVLADVLRLREVGEHEMAHRAIENAIDLLLGRDRMILENLEASAAASFAGVFELSRLRVYAVLLAEDGLVMEAEGRLVEAEALWQRALELFAAISRAGGPLESADRERIRALLPRLDPSRLDARYQDELTRLTA